MTFEASLDRLGPEIEDPEEGMKLSFIQTFLLFSREIPSQNLGFVDPHVSILDLTIAGRDFTIHQSPTVLNRPGSTTGAVLWKITPLIAEWLASSLSPSSAADNFLVAFGMLSSSSSVLELGCGISGLIGLAVAPFVSRYTLTDQFYVAKLVERNLEENIIKPSSISHKRKGRTKPGKPQKVGNLCFMSLDWELDEVMPSLTGDRDIRSFDIVLACDCIYNDALIKPLVQTCVDACLLRSRESWDVNGKSASTSQIIESQGPSTVCIVAQQLRDPEIFEAWMKAFHRQFRVLRVPDGVLSKELRSSPGFVIHLGILRNSGEPRIR